MHNNNRQEQRRVQVAAWVTQDEADRIRSLAQKRDVSVSKYINEIIINALNTPWTPDTHDPHYHDSNGI